MGRPCKGRNTLLSMYAETQALCYAGWVPAVRRLFTVGYEGKTLDFLSATLAEEGVEVLIDVRLTPWSRRRDFTRSQLESGLARVGIEYQHEPLLGNPPENREPFRSGSVKVGRARFRRRLNNGSAEALQALSQLVTKKTAAIMCVEEDEDRCHRQVIVEVLCAENTRLRVTRL